MWAGIKKYLPVANRISAAVRLGCFGALAVFSAIGTKAPKEGSSIAYDIALPTAVISAIDHLVKVKNHLMENDNPELHQLKAGWEAMKGGIMVAVCGTIILIKADAITEEQTAKAFMALLGAVGVESIGVAMSEYGLAGVTTLIFAAGFAAGLATGSPDVYCVSAAGAFASSLAVTVGRDNVVQAATCIWDGVKACVAVAAGHPQYQALRDGVELV